MALCPHAREIAALNASAAKRACQYRLCFFHLTRLSLEIHREVKNSSIVWRSSAGREAKRARAALASPACQRMALGQTCERARRQIAFRFPDLGCQADAPQGRCSPFAAACQEVGSSIGQAFAHIMDQQVGIRWKTVADNCGKRDCRAVLDTLPTSSHCDRFASYLTGRECTRPDEPTGNFRSHLLVLPQLGSGTATVAT